MHMFREIAQIPRLRFIRSMLNLPQHAIPQSLADSYTGRRKKGEEESQKIDHLTVLATYRSGTSAMLSSKFKGPIAHGSPR